MTGKRSKKLRSGGKRTVQERERDFTLITDWYVQGFTSGRMAELLSKRYQEEREDAEFSISRSQIQKDVEVIVGRWKEEEIVKISSMKAVAGQRIEALYREYWEAWIKSKGGTTESATDARMPKKGGKDTADGMAITTDGKVMVTQFKTTKSLPHGDIEFLRGAGQCVEQHIKLYGLAAPAKVAPTDPSGEKEYGANRMGEEERLQRLREIVMLGQTRQQQAERPTNELLAQAALYEAAEADPVREYISNDEDDLFDEEIEEYDESEDDEIDEEKGGWR